MGAIRGIVCTSQALSINMPLPARGSFSSELSHLSLSGSLSCRLLQRKPTAALGGARARRTASRRCGWARLVQLAQFRLLRATVSQSMPALAGAGGPNPFSPPGTIDPVTISFCSAESSNKRVSCPVIAAHDQARLPSRTIYGPIARYWKMRSRRRLQANAIWFFCVFWLIEVARRTALSLRGWRYSGRRVACDLALSFQRSTTVQKR